ncbi:MAG: hypothetical protein QNJ29_00160 [Rhizobiaceae bacterium]|nr:hypothetical protein [Rhizobiaceae bacterium]
MKSKILLFVVGYCIAVVVAVFVTEFFIFAPTIFPDGGRFGSFHNTLEGALVVFWAGILYTLATALPGFLMTVFYAAKSNRHTVGYYCICGVVTAILAHFLLALFLGGHFVQGIWIPVCSLPGGASGAYAYYRWRQKILSA